MTRLPQPLCALDWTPAIAAALADAAVAVARLDARVSASCVAPAWRLRAGWSGYGVALRLQQVELDEMDIIAERCGIRLPGRPPIETAGSPFGAYPSWVASLAQSADRHWREEFPFTFDPPAGWSDAPALVRALAVLDAWARRDHTLRPWLAFPVLLHRFGISEVVLPCLVVGDAGQRRANDGRPALLVRLLKQLRRTAENGLDRLKRLEDHAQRAAVAIAAERRAGMLTELGTLTLARPCIAARSLAPMLNITVSGAGKLLERATRLGILVETSGRATWRTYVSADIALSLGLATMPCGRPRKKSAVPPALDPILAAFDDEMAAIDKRLGQLHVR